MFKWHGVVGDDENNEKRGKKTEKGRGKVGGRRKRKEERHRDGRERKR